MKITITVNDGAVCVDGVAFLGLDLSFVPQDVHAVQVSGDICEVEYRLYYDGSAWVKPANTVSAAPSFVAAAKALWDAAAQRQAADNAAAAAQAAQSLGVATVSPTESV